MTGENKYRVGGTQGGTGTPGDNGNDPGGNQVPSLNHHKNDHLRILFSTAVARAIFVCHVWAGVSMTATRFCQSTTDDERYGINSR